ncbi:MAG: triose-phosphate isomerase [Desulfomonilaceae bacterium]
MAARRKMVAGNWKMHKTVSEALEYARELGDAFVERGTPCEVVVGPPFTALAPVAEVLRVAPVKIAAQDVFWEPQGAYTGEISPPMLKEIGCTYVIVGHSERRQYFGETNRSVGKKIRACQREGLIPIFCVGETLEQREKGITFPIVREQLLVGLEQADSSDPGRLIVAYEPVWAIGTGKTATPDQAQEVHHFIRSELAAVFGNGFGEAVRILYGGSVKPSNARDLFTCEDIDGGLVGGASLHKDEFLGIVYSGFDRD